MKLHDLYLKRESCRNFTGEKVSKEVITDILSEAMLAPSAVNRQPWYFHLIENEEIMSNITKPWREFTHHAGGMVVITTDNDPFVPQLRRHDFRSFDVGGISSHIILSAAERNVHTCLIGSFDDDLVKAELPMIANRKIHIIVLFGYGKDAPKEKIRVPLEERLTVV